MKHPLMRKMRAHNNQLIGKELLVGIAWVFVKAFGTLEISNI